MRVFAMSILLAGCVHPAPAPPPPVALCPFEPRPATPAGPRPVLHVLRWQLTIGREPPRNLPDELQAFTVGKWECALGKVQMDDTREPTQLRLNRTRRLACTHPSGTTVQTSLSCQSITGSPAFARSLPLSLDTAPPLTLSCTPVLVDRVSSVLGTVCASETGVTYCSAP